MKEETLEKVFNTKRNLIVSGDISTGKTNTVLFPLVDKMIEQNESLMILDSKEEYVNKYYSKLKEKNYNIIILNLRDMDKSDGWNPIEYAYKLYKNGYKDKAMDYLDKTAKTMFYEDSSVDPFWSLSASDFFTGVVLGLFEDAKEEEINLNSVNAMYDSINEKNGAKDYLTNYFKLKDTNSQAYISASSTVFAPNETKGSVVSVARQKLRTYVSREKLSLLLNKTTFNYNEVSEKPTAIFFIAKDESKYLNSIAAIFIEQLFSILFDIGVSNKFNFILDNFDNIEIVNEFCDMLGSGISRNIKFFISTRSLENLITKYGNYVTKLCNLIHNVEGWLKVKINDKEEVIENKYVDIEVTTNEVQYPQLNQNIINIFDIKEFVNNSKQNSFINGFNNSFVTNPFSGDINKPTKDFGPQNIDDLIKRIDAKIEELDKEEEIENKNKKKIENANDLIDSIDNKIKELEEQEKKDEINRKFLLSNNFLKLRHIPFHSAYGRIDELEKQQVVPMISYYDPYLSNELLIDKIKVYVDEATLDYVKLTIPYQNGIISNQEDYKLKQSTSITLNLNDKITLYLDVYDAMESWEISFVHLNDVQKINEKKEVNISSKSDMEEKESWTNIRPEYIEVLDNCPFCNSTNIKKYLYGDPSHDYDRDKYVLGGCEITIPSPTYKCCNCGKDIFNDDYLLSTKY